MTQQIQDLRQQVEETRRINTDLQKRRNQQNEFIGNIMDTFNYQMGDDAKDVLEQTFGPTNIPYKEIISEAKDYVEKSHDDEIFFS